MTSRLTHYCATAGESVTPARKKSPRATKPQVNWGTERVFAAQAGALARGGPYDGAVTVGADGELGDVGDVSDF
ncbi:hypothetical protein AQJ43_02940 [Streptomyces avermitilis]|uniref:Uncharacterized protein n=1 Tax=Streptomyces avermitilis TaxID=33903 RepID=A0A4D4MY03_STRAX|nr:hypothetical protein [Streptomyces avermitilis]KUN56569.1 hypothetical protein AQJ43_02940 [Streptomyces avermitilis]OOV32702.1 hypothetical protein SM007_07830 [Streptomyces avermitilis]BBJ51267.1 hypothetical protein SAVMC3_38960 [Streptomyces avermitilis]GDY63308.1 hypothetical protein SAV14893_027010 [Streptomyces avermitilis]GDY76556.1 hypothetical protein SAV31267_060410 [Streptomyces avermitilis]